MGLACPWLTGYMFMEELIIAPKINQVHEILWAGKWWHQHWRADVPLHLIHLQWCHMRIMASQITGHPEVCSTIYLVWQSEKKKSALPALCEGNPLVTGRFPFQWSSYVEIFSMSWCHHAVMLRKRPRPLGRLIFNMGIAIPGKTVFLIETAPTLTH